MQISPTGQVTAAQLLKVSLEFGMHAAWLGHGALAHLTRASWQVVPAEHLIVAQPPTGTSVVFTQTPWKPHGGSVQFFCTSMHSVPAEHFIVEHGVIWMLMSEPLPGNSGDGVSE